MNDYPILRFFTYAHLPEHLQAISGPFCDLAHELANMPVHTSAGIAEIAVALRKLLEAKDAAVRAAL